VIRELRFRQTRRGNILVVVLLLNSDCKVSVSLPLCAVGDAGAPEFGPILGTRGVGERWFWYLDALINECRTHVNGVGPAVERLGVATAGEEYDIVAPRAGSKAADEPRFARGGCGLLSGLPTTNCSAEPLGSVSR
jgi:hypothetical protein